MSMVRLDLETGTAHFGDHSMTFVKAVGGSLTLEGGTCLRPITFGERQHLLACAQIAAEPIASFLARLRRLALVREGGDADDAVSLFALVLAGANHSHHADTQAMTAIMAAHQLSYEALMALPASDVDEFALALSPPKPNPWHRWLFPQENLDSLAGLAEFLARQLLERQPDQVEPTSFSAQASLSTTSATTGSAGTSTTPPFRGGLAATAFPQPADLRLPEAATSAGVAEVAAHSDEHLSPAGFHGVRAAIRASRQQQDDGGTTAQLPPQPSIPAATSASFRPRMAQSDRSGQERHQPVVPTAPAPNAPLGPRPDRFSPTIALPPPDSPSATQQTTLTAPTPSAAAATIPFPRQNPAVPAPSGFATQTLTEAPGPQQAFAGAIPVRRIEPSRRHPPLPQKSGKFTPSLPPQTHQPAPGLGDLAQQMADLLHLEADLRGILP